MKHKWKCEECVKHGTDACYNGGRYDHDDCKYMLIDVDYAYNKGKADRDKEIAEHNVFFSSKPIEDIVLDARADERAKCKCPYWNEEHRECATSFEEDIRADERAKMIDEVDAIIDFIKNNSFDHNLEFDSFKVIGSSVVISLLKRLKETK